MAACHRRAQLHVHTDALPLILSAAIGGVRATRLASRFTGCVSPLSACHASSTNETDNYSRRRVSFSAQHGLCVFKIFYFLFVLSCSTAGTQFQRLFFAHAIPACHRHRSALLPLVTQGCAALPIILHMRVYKVLPTVGFTGRKNRFDQIF